MYRFHQGIIGDTGRVLGAVAIHSAYRSTHPDVPMKSIWDGLGFSINAFVPKLNVSLAAVHRHVLGKSSISPMRVTRLSATIGDTAKCWMQRQAEYDLQTACDKLISIQSRTRGGSDQLGTDIASNS